MDEYIELAIERAGRTRSFEMADLKSIREGGREGGRERSRSDEPRKRPLAKVWKEFR